MDFDMPIKNVRMGRPKLLPAIVKIIENGGIGILKSTQEITTTDLNKVALYKTINSNTKVTVSGMYPFGIFNLRLPCWVPFYAKHIRLVDGVQLLNNRQNLKRKIAQRGRVATKNPRANTGFKMLAGIKDLAHEKASLV